jgi:hypothetical protein
MGWRREGVMVCGVLVVVVVMVVVEVASQLWTDR